MIRAALACAVLALALLPASGGAQVVGGQGSAASLSNGTTGTGAIVLQTLPTLNTVIVSTKIRVSGTAPALTSCGTGSPTIAGTDAAGTVTMGTNATGCVITFNVAYASVPHCVVTWQANMLASQSYAISATAITLTQTSTSGNKANYACFAQSGG